MCYSKGITCLKVSQGSGVPYQAHLQKRTTSATLPCLPAVSFLCGRRRQRKGKGNTVIEQYGIDYKSGAWNLEWQEKSLNCRDAENLTDHLERLVANVSLLDHKVFLIRTTPLLRKLITRGILPQGTYQRSSSLSTRHTGTRISSFMSSTSQENG